MYFKAPFKAPEAGCTLSIVSLKKDINCIKIKKIKRELQLQAVTGLGVVSLGYRWLLAVLEWE